MKRRNFVQLLFALAGVPFLPKSAAKPQLHYGKLEAFEPLPVATVERPGQMPPSIHAGPEPMPVGTLSAYYGEYAPEGWVWCDGQVISEKHQKLVELFPSGTLPDLGRRFIMKAG